MTQLLISVKDVEEAILARYAGVDIVDLKDPENGALGALSTDVVSRIVVELDGVSLISATVGEGHTGVSALVSDINTYASLGVDVVKLSVSDLFLQKNFFNEMLQITARGIKLVVVFFAENPIDLALIKTLQQHGFYGAMLDTQLKTKCLLDTQTSEAINSFTMQCKKYGLISGLAGSVNKNHLDNLMEFKPDFIGMRGGVCVGKRRMAKLLQDEMVVAQKMLLNYNTSKGISNNMPPSGLHV